MQRDTQRDQAGSDDQDVDQDIVIERSMNRFDAALIVLAVLVLVAMIVIAATN